MIKQSELLKESVRKAVAQREGGDQGTGLWLYRPDVNQILLYSAKTCSLHCIYPNVVMNNVHLSSVRRSINSGITIFLGRYEKQ